ncbi:MAG: hypothetical protein ACYDHY_03120 [Acidiferrobacterales bacterium]
MHVPHPEASCCYVMAKGHECRLISGNGRPYAVLELELLLDWNFWKGRGLLPGGAA